MTLPLPQPPWLVAITDPRLRPDWLEAAVEAARAGVDWLLLRAPDLTLEDYARAAHVLAPVCRDAGARLLIHTHHAIAAEVGAAGVHLSSGVSLAPGLVSRSCHSLEEIEFSAKNGASFVFYSQIFPPHSKTTTFSPKGLEGLARAARGAGVPVVALGGIDRGNAGSCIEAGAVGVAAIGAIFGKGTVAGNVVALGDALRAARRKAAP